MLIKYIFPSSSSSLHSCRPLHRAVCCSRRLAISPLIHHTQCTPGIKKIALLADESFSIIFACECMICNNLLEHEAVDRQVDGPGAEDIRILIRLGHVPAMWTDMSQLCGQTCPSYVDRHVPARWTDMSRTDMSSCLHCYPAELTPILLATSKRKERICREQHVGGINYYFAVQLPYYLRACVNINGYAPLPIQV